MKKASFLESPMAVAVAALPAVIGEAKPAPEKPDAEAILRKVRAIAEVLTPDNAVEKKAALLAVLTTATCD